jgi:hypothetical protein
MGSGSTDSPAPSPTNAKIDITNAIETAVGIAVPTNIDTNAKIDIANAIDTAVGIAMPTNTDINAKIDIANAINTAVGIAVPANIDINAETNIGIIIDNTIDTVAGIVVPVIIDANPLEPEVDIVESIVIDIASSNATDLIPAAAIVGPTSGTTGAVSAITGGFDMAFGLFNFHVGNDGVAELISVGDSAQQPQAHHQSSRAIPRRSHRRRRWRRDQGRTIRPHQ